jgi:hypothetical protein
VEESKSSKEYFLYSSALDSKKKDSGALDEDEDVE